MIRAGGRVENKGRPKSLWTIGYGGRTPAEFTSMLKENGITTVADVRLRPDRASMGSYSRAKSPDKGIEKLLSSEGIEYIHFLELGNLFLDDIFDIAWKRRYAALLAVSGDILLERLIMVASYPQGRVCLLCAEKDYRSCHREDIARAMMEREFIVHHLM